MVTSRRFRVQVDGKVGYMDRGGRVVIEPQFDRLTFAFYPGSSELSHVHFQGKFGYIDRIGRYVWSPAK